MTDLSKLSVAELDDLVGCRLGTMGYFDLLTQQVAKDSQ